MKNTWNKAMEDKPGCLIDNIEAIEVEKSIKFPEMYLEMMLIQNGGYLNKYCFEYIDMYRSETIGEGAVFLSIGSHSPERFYETIEQYLSDAPEFFPENLIPFAEDGCGNLTCFDYRNTRKDPPIVFWCHEDSEGEDVHFIANSFEEFINMLHEPEDQC
jgi:hypothetical protein